MLVAVLALVTLLSPQRGDVENAPHEIDVERVDKIVSTFEKKSKAARKRILAKVRTAVDGVEDPYLRSVRAWIRKGADKKKARGKKVKTTRRNKKRQPGGPDPSLAEGLLFPVTNQYVFGTGTVVAVDRKGERGRRSRFPRSAPPAEQLRAMLYGYLPDLDLALAALLRDLDTDPRAAPFAAFLQGWRNGDEPFYRALDRSAGSSEGVFFYDAMLSDFVRTLVPRKHRDYAKIRGSNDAAHAAVHASFLAYRQYRGMREALAMALLLPSTARMPRVLDRYETTPPKGYSFREQAGLLLRLFEGDLDRVVAMLNASAPELPERLWTDRYDPWTAFNEAYDALIPKMLEIAHDTDAVLADQKARRDDTQRRVARAALDALRAQGIAR